MSYSGKTKVLTEQAVMAALSLPTRPRQIYAFYRSDLDCITLDSRFFSVPLDDRIFNRSHGVFDNLYIKNSKIQRLDEHLKRLQFSAKKVEIELPFSLQEIKNKIIDLAQLTASHLSSTCAFAEQIIGIKIWLSAGSGDFGLSSLGKVPILYCATFQPFINQKELKKGVKEFVCRVVDQDEGSMIAVKSTSYLQQCLQLNATKRKGGYQGLKITKKGFLREVAVANVAIVTKKGILASPRFETVLKGTTLEKCIQFSRQLIEQKLLSGVQIRDVHISQIDDAAQFLVIGGDKVVGVIQFQSRPVADGQVGPVCQRLSSMLDKANSEGTPIPGFEEMA